MKKLVLFVVGFLFLVSMLSAQFWTLDFETVGGYTTSVPEFTDTYNDFWLRTDGSDHNTTVVYNGVLGSYYFAGMDLDGEGATLPLFQDIDDIDISGQTNIEFKIYLAEDQSGDGYEDWDATDYFHIGYDIDNTGTFTPLLWVESSITTNGAPLIDTNFDGIGDGTEIDTTFVQFTASIPGTGSLLDLQLEYSMNSGDEDIAIDHLQLFVGGATTPTITTSLSSLTGFSYYVGFGPSTEQFFTVEGIDLTADISVTPPTDYEISLDNISYQLTPITLTQTGGVVATTTIYTRLTAGLSAGAYDNENITMSSAGATDKIVTCSGAVIKLEPTNHVTGFIATADGFQRIDLAWLANDGVVVPDGYLIKASTTITITDPSDGTPVVDNLTIGDDSGAMNIAHGTDVYEWVGLDPETIYYFNIYPYTNSGTSIDYKTDGTIPSDDATTGVLPPAPDVFFSEYIEGGGNRKALEIFNASGAAINLDNFRINQSVNGGGWAYQHNFPVSATVADGDVWVIITSDVILPYFDPANADEVLAYPSVVHHNGDDARGLEYTADGGANWFLIDVIGVPTEDPGFYWLVGGVNGTQNHTLVRKQTVTTGNTDWASSAGTDLDDTEWLIEAEDTFDYLGAHTMGGNVAPFITNITRTPAGDILPTTTVSVSANVTDSDGTINLVELHWGINSGFLIYTINMSNVIGDVYTTVTDIPAWALGATIYYEVYAEDNVPESSTSAEYDYTVVEAASTTLPYLESFDADLGDCYTNSVSGATKEWYWHSSGYAYMSGYNSGDTEEDWLILPAVDFDNYTDETMTFDTWYNYGTDNATNYLKLYYSADYPGLGDPSGYTWTELSYTQPGASSTWTPSGSIDLSAIPGTSVYIAFKYHYEVGLYRNWGVDNLSIIAGTLPLDADFEADQTFVPPGTTVNFTDLTADGVAPYSYEWDFDYDGVTFDIDDTEPNPSFEYVSEGVYDVALRVTDDELTEDTEIKVNYITVAEIPTGIIINEVDADQDGTDAAEFVELYDGGSGNTALDGLVLVLFNGSDDASYMSYDLDGYSTDANGYFVIGSSLVPNVDYDLGALTNIIQNGADAVALFTGDAVDFPNDTPLTTTGLIDAIVYDTNDGDDAGLLPLLNPSEPQVNEGENGASATESNQRIPNGSGGARNTSTYSQTVPTPGAENVLGTIDVPLNVTISAVQNGIDADVTISWDAVAGATSYTVYRTDDPYATFPDDWTAQIGISGTSWSYVSHSPIRFYIVTANN